MEIHFFSPPFFFGWNTGNSQKNFHKHGVSDGECEEIFFDVEKILLNDHKHSNTEKRWVLIGTTRKKRKLAVIFTVRLNKLRVISARDLNKKERKLYEETIKNSSV